MRTLPSCLLLSVLWLPALRLSPLSAGCPVYGPVWFGCLSACVLRAVVLVVHGLVETLIRFMRSLCVGGLPAKFGSGESTVRRACRWLASAMGLPSTLEWSFSQCFVNLEILFSPPYLHSPPI